MGRRRTKGKAAIIDEETFAVLGLPQTRTLHNDSTTGCLTGVVTLLGAAWAAIGGAALLWHNLTASRPLDSITSLAALWKAVKNKLLSNAENWGIDALTLIICPLVYFFDPTIHGPRQFA